jgi:hypothetical protein
METTFAKWLAARGETMNAFGLRMGMNRERVRFLAGVSREPRLMGLRICFHVPSLTAISDETGIPIETLIADATKAAVNPLPPRQYNRKEKDDGKATAAE